MTQTPTQIVDAVFSIANIAVMALQMIPGVPPLIVAAVKTGLTDAEALYTQYQANPSADLIDQIQTVVTDVLEDVKNALHPPTP
jgi:hypothetical protein